MFLMQRASVPYFVCFVIYLYFNDPKNLLRQWIYQGVIHDIYQEFFVEQHNADKSNREIDYLDTYWEERYSIRPAMVPGNTFLFVVFTCLVFIAEWAQKILTTGKQLNAIRECGEAIQSDNNDPLTYSTNSSHYAEIFEKACVYMKTMSYF